MPKRKDLRLIPGGKADGALPTWSLGPSESSELLLARADRYRALAATSSNGEIPNLIDDLIDAIKALALLEKSDAASAPHQVLEYRRLIADLEIEIVTALGQH